MEKTLTYINPVDVLIEDGFNPRYDFTGHEDLVLSIIENGVKIPITIFLNGDEKPVLVDGERRLRATLEAIARKHPIDKIPAIVEDKLSFKDRIYVSLISNDGKPLLPLEEAHAFHKLLKEGQKIEDIAKKIGKGDGHVRNRLKLLEASEEVKTALRQKKIGVSVATEIVKKAKSPEEQKSMVDKATSNPSGKAQIKRELNLVPANSKVKELKQDLSETEDELSAANSRIEELEKQLGEMQSVPGVVKLVTKVLNTMDDDKVSQMFCSEMATQHRTLQQNYTRLCVRWLLLLSTTENFDARNAASVSLGKKFATLLKKDCYLPVV